ncbi:MAG TPA: hypothetical protein VJ385_21120 [Fibrobacteria bacterium]|nr:hypothetical protein [Fibrobacteria bacterium]
MKFNGTAGKSGPLSIPLLLALALPSHTFANSIIAGGRVPERLHLTVTRESGTGFTSSGAAKEIAIIEIDNNLPEYELALELSDRYGGDAGISGVRLEGLDGTLGNGLREPAGLDLEAGGAPGRFLWRPGRQMSATLNYRVRVLATFNGPAPESPRLMVSMPFAY